MPKLAIYKNLIFYIVSFDLSEKIHVHVFSKSKGRSSPAKIWLDRLEVFSEGSLSSDEISLSLKLLERNSKLLVKQIEDFRNGKKTKTIELKLK